MRSIVLLVITCSTLLHTVPISTVPISVQSDQVSTGSGEPTELYHTSSTDADPSSPNSDVTDAPTTMEDADASVEEDKSSDKETTTTDEEVKSSDEETATTDEEDKSSDKETTTTPSTTQAITTSKPPVMCKDLEMTSNKYPYQLGDIPKSPEENERVLPINAIKLPRKSCKELYNDGYDKSGIYIIKPNRTEITVFCDMTLCGGGWTVIQRRLNNADIFNTDYNNYQRGFGDLSSSFWVGLDAMHWLTSSSTELYVGLHREHPSFSFFSVSSAAHYQSFQVGSEADQYRLSVSDYSTTLPTACISGGWGSLAGESLIGTHNGKTFSASDMDDDTDDKVNCASINKGGWWYKVEEKESDCHYGNVNAEGIIWDSFLQNTVLTHSLMAVR